MPVDLPIDAVVDARGLSCPLPLLKAKQALNSMLAGQTLHVMATDAGSERDFQRFAELSGNYLLEARVLDGEFHYWLRKAD
ncbi:sulfurtransferase TusA family protein [Halopseudomonas pachastrellae]|jgi:TusA-related sulfurtransferase|nr:sulfurtransferase TusA family protein [Halopseudomonas pachastrellae]MED5492962.1 sulfurtransferase TusA family protein [Pseudomonadota bacterium]WVM88066.1 sulfurtransferase TusA family protein [Halopseudomonas pachastrellae]